MAVFSIGRYLFDVVGDARLPDRLRAALPSLLFGLRLWAAVCLALYAAFCLELDNAQWAGTTAAIVSQASLGASLRKGSFRMIGTVIGAVAAVVLASCFPQSRVGFLLGLALWSAVCGLVATILRNFTAYGAALAGYTAVIIASDALGPTGGANDEIFMLAVDRVAAIWLGIVVAGIVAACTDFGGAKRRLCRQLAGLSAEIASGFATTFSLPGPKQGETRTLRRAFAARVVALGPVIDEAIGEASRLRYRVRGLQASVDGLFAAISGWRAVATRIERSSDEAGKRESGIIFGTLPRTLRAEMTEGDAAVWAAEPSRLRLDFQRAVRALVVLPADRPSLRLMADATAATLLALSRALDGLSLLRDERQVAPQRYVRHPIADPLPAILNAARVFVTMAAVELFWVVTAWPSGGTAMDFAAIGVILFSPQEDRAYATAKTFLIGTGLVAALVWLVNFAVLPAAHTFLGFGLSLGLVLVPVGALSVQSWLGPVFASMIVFFIPLLGPANQMTYDPEQLYNATLAALGGIGAATLALVLLPPLPPALRARRLLALTLRDLRRLAAGSTTWTAGNWEGRVYGRVTVMPASTEPLQFTWLVAALSIGPEIVHLRRFAPRLGLAPDIDAALGALAAGDSAAAIRRLSRIDRRLAALPNMGTGAMMRLRVRSGILAITETLAQHAAYFDGQAVR
ncbi:MAG TPA: FUSC family protein [Dongiaceae bacterium]|jgi:uncharacterized membrane protein YccC